MNATAFDGIFSAMLTPLKEDESYDAEAGERLAHALLDEGQRGLYVAGGTGEEYAIDDSVRVAAFGVTARASQVRGKNERIIAHVGGVPTRRAASLARAAAEAGCHAIAAIPPHGGKYSYEELTGYYRALAAATPLPLFVYHIPEVSGYDYSREHLSRWLEMPNVLGMKFTSFDLFRLERLAALHPDKVIFSGADQMLAQGLASGARGAIGSTYNLAGPLALRIYAAVRDNNMAAAILLQGRLNHFIEHFLAEGRLRGFKALAAERFGWASACSPAPGLTPSTSALEGMRQALACALQLDPATAA